MLGVGLHLLSVAVRQGHGGHVGSPYTLTANRGVFALTGIAAALTYSGAVGSTYALTVGAGTFTLNGDDMAPTVSYLLGAGTGSFVETGIAATLTKSGTGITLVAHAIAGASSAPTTSAINTTGANLLVVSVSQFQGVTVGTLTDSKSNTWTALTAKLGASEAYNRIFYCASPTVGSGHTFTWDNGGSIFGALAVQAWSGANVAPFDVQNGAVAGTGTTIQPGSVTPNQNNSLVVTSVDPIFAGGSSGYAIDGGFTISDSIASQSGIEGLAMAYLVQTSAAAANPNWSWTGAAESAATIAVFKP